MPRGSGKKVMLRPVEKQVNWIMDVVLKYCKVRELVMDCSAGALATLRSCLQFLQYRRFVRFEKDSICFVKWLSSLMEVFARQALNTESDLVENELLVEICKVFFKSMEAISSRRRVDSWAVPAGLVPVQTFFMHIMHFFGNTYKNAVLYEKRWHIPLSLWSVKW